MNKAFYPIHKYKKRPQYFLLEEEIPRYIKIWAYNDYTKRHSGELSEIITGTNLILEESLSRKFNLLILNGRTEQEQLTGKNLINIFGENAFNYGSGLNKTTVNQNGVITTTSNFASTRNKGTLIENLEQNTNYTVSLFVDSITTESSQKSVEIEAIAYSADNTYIGVVFQQQYNNSVGTTINKTFNSGSYEKIAIHVSGYYLSTSDTGTLVYHNYMVEQGSIATSYEPYCRRNTSTKFIL